MDQQRRVDAMKEIDDALYYVDSCGPSRNVSLARTKLEEAYFWLQATFVTDIHTLHGVDTSELG
jgi:hypothetical protein